MVDAERTYSFVDLAAGRRDGGDRGVSGIAAPRLRGGLEQELGDLHGVEGGTFEELVPDHPES